MNNGFKKFLLWLSILLSIIVVISFLFVLFDTSSFVASVRQTFEQTCESLIDIYTIDDGDSIKITAEELKAAQSYISEAGEFFSVSANNSILSIIYAFVTTIMLSIGSFLLGKITLKSSEIEKDLNDLRKNIENDSTEINNLKRINTQLLEFQNVISYILFSTILIFDCEKNLRIKADNFKILDDITNRLGMIPDSIRCINMNQLDVNSEDSEVEKSLLSNFEDFRRLYIGLIKHYIDYYKDHPNDSDNKEKIKDIERELSNIDEIIEDIQRRLNSGFFILP